MSVIDAGLTGLQVGLTAGMLVSFMRATRVMQKRSALRWQVAGAAPRMFAEHGESSRVAVRRQWVACLDDLCAPGELPQPRPALRSAPHAQ